MVSPKTREQLIAETASDKTLAQVMNSLEHQRPIQGRYRALEGELTVVDGILFKGTKVVIPHSMRKIILERIHDGHLGINKCKARARELVFWQLVSMKTSSLLFSDVEFVSSMRIGCQVSPFLCGQFLTSRGIELALIFSSMLVPLTS